MMEYDGFSSHVWLPEGKSTRGYGLPIQEHLPKGLAGFVPSCWARWRLWRWLPLWSSWDQGPMASRGNAVRSWGMPRWSSFETLQIRFLCFSGHVWRIKGWPIFVFLFVMFGPCPACPVQSWQCWSPFQSGSRGSGPCSSGFAVGDTPAENIRQERLVNWDGALVFEFSISPKIRPVMPWDARLVSLCAKVVVETSRLAWGCLLSRKALCNPNQADRVNVRSKSMIQGCTNAGHSLRYQPSICSWGNYILLQFWPFPFSPLTAKCGCRWFGFLFACSAVLAVSIEYSWISHSL